MTVDDFIDCVEKRAALNAELARLNKEITRAAAAHKPGLYQGAATKGSRVLQIIHSEVNGFADARSPEIAYNLSENRVTK